MSDEFQIPATPSDLLDEDVGSGLKVLRDVSLADLDAEALAGLADGKGCLGSGMLRRTELLKLFTSILRTHRQIVDTGDAVHLTQMLWCAQMPCTHCARWMHLILLSSQCSTRCTVSSGEAAVGAMHASLL